MSNNIGTVDRILRILGGVQVAHADIRLRNRLQQPDLAEIVRSLVDMSDVHCSLECLGCEVGSAAFQLRIAETEKYAHVTFFFNGGVEEPFEGEDRILVPSPLVATYDLQPEMSAPQVTDHLLEAIQSGKYDVIICNYANPDMVGHTGKFDAAVKAIEAIDSCLGRVVPAIQAAGGELLVTADHGNAEQMRGRETDQPHTAHTSNMVPLLYVGRPATLEDGVLVVKGKRTAEQESASAELHRHERLHGTFQRQFTLPDTVDAEHINATVKDGVLEIAIPKQEKLQPKKITVN